ncbi:esterase [Clostridia bacterium]|nr:esterase [Clostridia bacterium]
MAETDKTADIKPSESTISGKSRSAPDFKDAKCKPFFFKGGSVGVLLIHGFTGSPSHMRPLGEALRDAGYTVRGILLPGHADSLEAMERSNWSEWLEASEKAYKRLAEDCDQVVVGGLSMGGAIACYLAEKYPVKALLTYAPALKPKHSYIKYAHLVKHFMPHVGWSGNSLLHDEGFMKEYNIGYNGLPVSKVDDLIKIYTMANEQLKKITCPVFVAQSKFDEQVHKDVPDMLKAGVSSKVCEVLWLTKSPHVCTIGADHDVVFDRTLQFLRNNVDSK